MVRKIGMKAVERNSAVDEAAGRRQERSPSAAKENLDSGKTERPFWLIDRDITNNFTTENVGDRQPVAVPGSPVQDLAPEQPAGQRVQAVKHAHPQSTPPPSPDQLRRRVNGTGTPENPMPPDPAAAPLVTDAEAGGHPPSEAELANATQLEVRVRPMGRRSGRNILGGWLVVASAILLFLVLATILGTGTP